MCCSSRKYRLSRLTTTVGPSRGEVGDFCLEECNLAPREVSRLRLRAANLTLREGWGGGKSLVTAHFAASLQLDCWAHLSRPPTSCRLGGADAVDRKASAAYEARTVGIS